MKKIAYGKIGRVFDVDWGKWGVVGGDHEPAFLLLQLADRNPDVEWVVVGKNRGWDPPRPNITNMWQQWHDELAITRKKDTSTLDKIAEFDRVTFPTFRELDGILMWIGQHGTSNTPLPTVEDRSVATSPQQSFLNYSAFILRGINVWRKEDPIAREEVWLLSDVRNYIKCRDLKWPRRRPILSQFDFTHTQWCERYGHDGSPDMFGFENVATQADGMWRTTDRYVASGLELTPVLDPHNENFDLPGFHDRPYGFGIVANEARNYGMKPELTRVHTMGEYAMPLNPDWFHGTWSEESQKKLGREIKPTPYGDFYSMLEQTKITITTPTSGSGWPTPKAWEAFRSGTVCFFHPQYDTQGHILPTDPNDQRYDEVTHWLASWLRVKSPEDFWAKAKIVMKDPTTFTWLQSIQRQYFESEKKQQRCITTIEERLGI